MKVKEIMTSEVSKVSAGAMVSEAAKLMDIKDIGSLPVDENKEIVGIITERDILRKIVARGKDPKTTAVKDIMSSPVIMINAEKTIEEANDLMHENKIRRLPVEEDGDIVGIITLRDVSNSLKYSIGRRIIGDGGIRPG